MPYVNKDGQELDNRLSALVNKFLLKSIHRAQINVSVINKYAVRFYDARYPAMPEMGRLYYDGDMLVVKSRVIANEKFSTYSSGYHTVRSKKDDKVSKNMLQYIKPFSVYDAWETHINKFEDFFIKWREGPKEPCISMFRNVTYSEFFEEVLRVEAEGGPFKHPKFLKCIEIGKESFAEARRRAKVKGKLHYVHYVADGVMTLSTDINDRKTKQEGALNLANESELPEIIKSNTPMLKMLSHGEGIPEIGMRLSENEFFVIELLESNVA